MKRVLAIFLMAWLPLFMQGAWAMSTRMAVQDAHMTIGLQANMDAASEAMPCHQPMAETGGQSDKQTHKCVHCLVCMVVNASASFDSAPHIYLPDLTQGISCSTCVLYVSVHPAPVIKPPILS